MCSRRGEHARGVAGGLANSDYMHVADVQERVEAKGDAEAEQQELEMIHVQVLAVAPQHTFAWHGCPHVRKELQVRGRDLATAAPRHHGECSVGSADHQAQEPTRLLTHAPC